MKKIIAAIAVVVIVVAAVAVGGYRILIQDSGLQDGYYTAEMTEYEHGWKEFVTIYVQKGNVVTVDFNAKNPSGFIKAWDMEYMRNMYPVQGTYPNRYTRLYGASFLESQDPEQIDGVSGATTSGNNFRRLIAAVLEKAQAGDGTVALVSP